MIDIIEIVKTNIKSDIKILNENDDITDFHSINDI